MHETLIQRACKKLNIPCIPSRMAMLTKPINGRAACHYCGQCGRGCQTASAFSSSQAMIFPAMKTGRLTIFTGAMARELITDASGKVTAVSYVDKATRTEKQMRCRAVVVAASACESARLLLNSKSPRFSERPRELIRVRSGRNLTDTVGYSMGGYVPALAGMPRHNSDGIGGMHVYMPWWLHDDKKKDFPRGYHIEIGGGFGMPHAGLVSPASARGTKATARSSRTRSARSTAAFVGFAGRGEMIPNEDCFCDIDPQRWIAAAFRCCVSISAGASTKSSR